jgi:hypothetical protein
MSFSLPEDLPFVGIPAAPSFAEAQSSGARGTSPLRNVSTDRHRMPSMRRGFGAEVEQRHIGLGIVLAEGLQSLQIPRLHRVSDTPMDCQAPRPFG